MNYEQAEDRARQILREGGSTCAQIATETGLPEWHVVEMSHEIHEERDRLIGDIRSLIGPTGDCGSSHIYSNREYHRVN